jgi:hypothetical protein
VSGPVFDLDQALIWVLTRDAALVATTESYYALLFTGELGLDPDHQLPVRSSDIHDKRRLNEAAASELLSRAISDGSVCINGICPGEARQRPVEQFEVMENRIVPGSNGEPQLQIPDRTPDSWKTGGWLTIECVRLSRDDMEMTFPSSQEATVARPERENQGVRSSVSAQTLQPIAPHPAHRSRELRDKAKKTLVDIGAAANSEKVSTLTEMVKECIGPVSRRTIQRARAEIAAEKAAKT